MRDPEDLAATIGLQQRQLAAAEARLATVWAMAVRAARKGYDLDPDEVLDALSPTSYRPA